jgi:hypothetical protein
MREPRAGDRVNVYPADVDARTAPMQLAIEAKIVAWGPDFSLVGFDDADGDPSVSIVKSSRVRRIFDAAAEAAEFRADYQPAIAKLMTAIAVAGERIDAAAADGSRADVLQLVRSLLPELLTLIAMFGKLPPELLPIVNRVADKVAALADVAEVA